MKRSIWFASAALLFMLSPCQAGFFDDLYREVLPSVQQQGTLDNSTIVKGLKEALATGTERAVTEVAKTDGYFGNQLIKILLPDKVQQVTDLLGEIGFRQQVDEFVLSMNRAAEKAAPKAARFFGDAIREMTVEDAMGILNGGDTAATKFFEKKTRPKLFEAFKPSVAKSMDQVGTARTYKEMIGTYETIPLASLVGTPSLDLDTYVTNKALDGLFIKVGEEEKKIRTNPAARTTDLLRKVFGGK
jgi:RNA binding exosome subunit